VEAALRSDDNALLFMGAGWALRFLLALQDRDSRYALADELTRRPRTGARFGDLGVCVLSCGCVLLEHGDRSGAERQWEELTELAARTHDAWLASLVKETELWLAFTDGRFDEILSQFAEPEASRIHLRSDLYNAILRLRAHVHRGQTQHVEALLSRGATRPTLAVNGLILAHLGRHAEAASIRQRFGDLSSADDRSGLHILLCLFEAALLGGDAATVHDLAARLAPLASTVAYHVSVGRLLAAAAALLGDRDQARRYYDEALEACRRIRFRPETALVHLQYAELLLDDAMEAQRTEALEHLDFAIAEFREMKMQPALERGLRHKDVLKA